MTKACTKCRRIWPATNEYFYPHPDGQFGLNPRCKECARESARTRSKVAKRRSRLQSKYNLSLQDYQSLAQKQDNKCAICRQSEPREGWNLAVDHCHKTGRIRGLLCHMCNTAIGKMNDDPVLLQRAVEYLQEQF